MESLGDDPRAAINASFDDDGSPVVHLAGELDMLTVPEIEAALASLIADASPPVTFDLSELEFMDSSGIAMLLRAVDKTGPVSIRTPSRTVRQVIRATGLQDMLHIEA